MRTLTANYGNGKIVSVTCDEDSAYNLIETMFDAGAITVSTGN